MRNKIGGSHKNILRGKEQGSRNTAMHPGGQSKNLHIGELQFNQSTEEGGGKIMEFGVKDWISR